MQGLSRPCFAQPNAAPKELDPHAQSDYRPNYFSDFYHERQLVFVSLFLYGQKLSARD